MLKNKYKLFFQPSLFYNTDYFRLYLKLKKLLHQLGNISNLYGISQFNHFIL